MQPFRRPLMAALCLAVSSPALAGTTTPPPRVCEVVPTKSIARADVKVREAAHKGLSYLAKSSRAWTAQHNCFGCHVQAVTLEALTVGKKHQYDVDPKDLDAMVKALKLGVTAGGRTTGVAFEGSAWARYDQWVSDSQTAELLRYAAELVTLQAHDGSIPDDDRRLPVTGGTLQTTFQAAQAWRQAHARTADDKWLAPMRRAEAYLAGQSAKWSKAGAEVYVQDLDFALLGLVASGVSRSEKSAERLVSLLLERQNRDGGWGLDRQKSDAFATGQVVYTLKMAGFSDHDTAVQRAMKFLVDHQDASGAWRTHASSQGGAEKAETMWAVLGLVTVDVASVAVKGLADGQHVEPKMTLKIDAADNQGGGIKQLELLVDDLATRTECGSTLTHELDTSKLAAGKHVIDVVATNARGQQSRRRFEVYAGDVFLTGVGAQFDERAQATTVSLRNIAPETEKTGKVELEVFTVKEGAESAPTDKVFSAAKQGELGALAFQFAGKDDKGKALPRGKYVAKLTFRDASGKVRQQETAPFFHDSETVQRQAFGEVEGNIALKGGQGSANTVVELVDGRGRVVQQTRTTEQGNYRFKTVDKGEYKVRVRKQGFADLEQPVQAAPASAPSKASMGW